MEGAHRAMGTNEQPSPGPCLAPHQRESSCGQEAYVFCAKDIAEVEGQALSMCSLETGACFASCVGIEWAQVTHSDLSMEHMLSGLCRGRSKATRSQDYSQVGRSHVMTHCCHRRFAVWNAIGVCVEKGHPSGLSIRKPLEGLLGRGSHKDSQPLRTDILLQ